MNSYTRSFRNVLIDRTYVLTSGEKVRVFEAVETAEGTLYTGVEIDSHGNERKYFPDFEYEDLYGCEAVPCMREFRVKDVVRRAIGRRKRSYAKCSF
ncbi:MAG: hypothetical protein Q4B26_01495 [Eubacteriales bacterium]|nr:hypothetical protein [Eubacteriales bacterium]